MSAETVPPGYIVGTTLFDIGSELIDLSAVLENEDFSPELRASALDAYFEGATGVKIAKKVDDYAALIQMYKRDAESCEAEIFRLTERMTAAQNIGKRLKARLLTFFKMAKLTTVKGRRFTVSRCGNGGKEPLVYCENFDAKQIPGAVQSVTIKINGDHLNELRALLSHVANNNGDPYWELTAERLAENIEQSCLIEPNTELLRELLAHDAISTLGVTIGERGEHIRVK